MQLVDFTVQTNEPIARNIWRIVLTPVSACRLPHPGQFVNLAVEGHYLRRPISVCDWDGQALTLIYKVVGSGTARLAQYQAGEVIDCLTNLGNGYTIAQAKRPLLLGGGVGVPPLYYLAKHLVQAGQQPIAVLGFRCADECFYEDEFSQICKTVVMTEDGSRGGKGFVTHALPELDYDALYTCGPEAMLKAVYNQSADLTPGHAQFSFERRMGCGFGACMTCSCKTITGYKRICKDGPVLAKEEIIWT